MVFLLVESFPDFLTHMGIEVIFTGKNCKYIFSIRRKGYTYIFVYKVVFILV